MSTSYLEKLDRLKKDEYQKAAFESRNNTVVLADREVEKQRF